MRPTTDSPPEGIFGRAEQRRALDAAVDVGLGGGPSVTLIVGDAGIGKTTLVDLVVAGRAGAGVKVLRGFADEAGGAAFSLWAGVRHGLRTGPPPSDGGVEERRWEQVEILSEAIGAAAPTLVVLEDAHWADQDSMWVLAHLPHVLAGVRAAFVVTSRDDSVGRMRPNHVVALAGLEASEVAELVGALGRDMAAGDLGRLAELTGGNPLFVRELAIHGERAGLPSAVEDALEWSLSGLDDEVLDVLLALALGGTELPRQVLADAVGRGPAEVEAGLDAAIGHGVLVPGARERPSFRHALLAAAVRRRAGPRRCRAVHAALGTRWSTLDGSAWAAAEAARHRLAAVPETDASEAARLAVEAGRGLVDAGDPGAAAELLRTAEAVAAAHLAGDPVLRAELLVERGDALDRIGNEAAALDAYEKAVAVARHSDDARVHARAAAGAARYLNPLEPNPATAQGLAAALEALGEADASLRVRLLGRLAWASVSGADVAAAPRHGDEAVRIARSLGDADLLAEALVARNFAPLDRGGVEARHAAAAELVGLGERHRSLRVTMLGLEWLFDTSLDTGDLAAATDALDRFEDIAAVVTSPRPRHRACILRGILQVVHGDRAGALALFDRSLEIGRGALPERELRTMHMALRATTAWVWGVPDAAWAETFEAVRQVDLPSTSPFFAVRHAQFELMAGDEDAARALLVPLLGDPAALLRGYQAIPTLLLAGELVCELMLAGAHVATLQRMFGPLAGLLGMGAGISPGIDATLGRLALLEGDAARAVTHLGAAVALTTSLPSPPLEARARTYLADALEAAGERAAAATERAAAERVADGIGMDLHRDSGRARRGPPARVPQRRARLVHKGARWELEAPHGAASVPHTVGMGHLARLVGDPGRDVAATDLAGMATPQAGLGPVLDAQAKRAYRTRVGELEAEIDEAQEYADPYREERARQELAAVMDELRRATGLWGRDRPSGSGAERARVNVTRNLRRAIAAIAAELPALGSHLEVSVRTGAFCRYDPEPAAAIEWVVET